jgi:hypothetical protein
LYNSPLCKVWFWRATLPLASPTNSPERGLAASQPRSDRLRGLPDCRPSHFRIPRPHPEDLAKPDQPHQLAFAPGCHAFCKQKERAAPALRSLQAGAQQQADAHVKAANRPAGVPARRISRKSPAPPRKGRAPCIPLRRRLQPGFAVLLPKPTTSQEAPKTSRALRAPNKPPSTKHAGAGQSDSDAPQAPLAADCRPSQRTNHKKAPHSRTAKSGRAFAPCKNEEIRKRKNHSKKLIPNTQPSPDIRALLLQLPGCHAFCKKNSKKSARQPSASTRRRSEVNRCSVIAANRPAGVPARRISILSPAPPRKDRAPCIPLRRGLSHVPAFCLKPIIKKTPIHQTENRQEPSSQATAATCQRL